MAQTAVTKKKAFCPTEYHTLEEVIVCEPKYMRITEIINETQKHYVKDNISIETAMQQHEHFIHVLEREGTKVIRLEPSAAFNEQVFTRDIGFTLGDQLFISSMSANVRKGEEEMLKAWLDVQQVPYTESPVSIEGGDVLIDGKTVYIGLSGRTAKEAVSFIQSLLPDTIVQPIRFDPAFLHLDCVFNILSPYEALIYPPALAKKELRLLEKKFDLIEVSSEERFTMGTNVLSIGKQKVISLPMNKQVNKQLRNRGYDVIEADISEIIKSGGSFRCCTLPVRRASTN